MQKKLVVPAYIPPRIVKGASAWVIVWYETNPATGDLERFRKTFSLNRIPNKTQRAERAKAILQDVAGRLAAGGYIYAGNPQPTGQLYTPILEAIALALRIKMQSDSRETRNTYRSTCKIFCDWLQSENLAGWPVMRFSKREAMAFLDHVRLKRGVGERTHNNYLICLKAIFNELKAREHVLINPFDLIAKKRIPKKQRRNFTQEERRIVAAWIAKHHPGLFRAVLLSYYCFIRPNEMRQMQIGCIDQAKQIIRLPAEITKMNKDRVVTIPADIAPFLVVDSPSNWYLFSGVDLQPGRTPAGKNRFNLAHRRALEHLFRAGAINTITGLSFYSWKDSGLTDLSESISIIDLMKQAGHHDPKITMKYIHERPAKEMRDVKNNILK